ncbi:MAG: hypothetical protein Q9170_003071 [Blastenia crenularia]
MQSELAFILVVVGAIVAASPAPHPPAVVPHYSAVIPHLPSVAMTTSIPMGHGPVVASLPPVFSTETLGTVTTHVIDITSTLPKPTVVIGPGLAIIFPTTSAAFVTSYVTKHRTEPEVDTATLAPVLIEPHGPILYPLSPPEELANVARAFHPKNPKGQPKHEDPPVAERDLDSRTSSDLPKRENPDAIYVTPEPEKCWSNSIDPPVVDHSGPEWKGDDLTWCNMYPPPKKVRGVKDDDLLDGDRKAEKPKIVKWRLCHDAEGSWPCHITCGSENAEKDGTCGRSASGV